MLSDPEVVLDGVFFRFLTLLPLLQLKSLLISNFEAEVWAEVWAEAWVWEADVHGTGKALEIEWLPDLPSLHVDSSLSTAFSSSFVLSTTCCLRVSLSSISNKQQSHVESGECFFFFASTMCLHVEVELRKRKKISSVSAVAHKQLSAKRNLSYKMNLSTKIAPPRSICKKQHQFFKTICKKNSTIF